MVPTTVMPVTQTVVLLMLSLAALSSGHELTERLLRSRSSYGLSGCLVNCEAGMLECSLECLFQTPLKCLADCFLTPGNILDPNTCSQRCTDSVIDCLQDCNDSPSPSPPLRSAPAPSSPPFHSPVHRPVPLI